MGKKLKDVIESSAFDPDLIDLDSMTMEELEHLISILERAPDDIKALEENLDLISRNETIH